MELNRKTIEIIEKPWKIIEQTIEHNRNSNGK